MRIENYMIQQYKIHEKITFRQRIEPGELAYSLGFMEAISRIYVKMIGRRLEDDIKKTRRRSKKTKTMMSN